MNVINRLFMDPIKRAVLFCVLAFVAGFVFNSDSFSKKTASVSRTPTTKCVQKEIDPFCKENKTQKKESILARLLDPILSKENSKEENKKVENTNESKVSNQQSTNNNANSTSTTLPTPTTHIQQPTSYQMPTNIPQPTQVVIPNQTIPTATQVPTPTQAVATILHVTSCSFWSLNYCRNNGQTYSYTRLRVKRSDTGEVLHASTLNNGGGYFSGFPVDVPLDIILLPPTDRPDQCGDIATIEFGYGHMNISVELVIRPSGSSPCITP